MKVPSPHFLLYSQARPQQAGGGQWRFVLESADGSERLEAADEEPATAQRLELMALVRGLEALDQPSKVTLVTKSRYVSRGIRFGLAQWREDGWQWERYGEMSPIKDHDLWRRVDQALQFHEVDCRSPRIDASDDLRAPGLRLAESENAVEGSESVPQVRTRRYRGKQLRFDPGGAPCPASRSRPARPSRGRTTWFVRLRTWFGQSWRHLASRGRR